MIRLDGKIVVITGAMGALGQTVTSVFSRSGATLVVVDRQVPKELPGEMLGLTADVTDAAHVQRLMETVIQKAGRIDCLINLVGGFAMGRVTETDRSLWDK
ncbi:MAG: SDR family NAD(P)-dependent oxidoreductase, partial [Candidatus Methylomirabilaceae bacterium]